MAFIRAVKFPSTSRSPQSIVVPVKKCDGDGHPLELDLAGFSPSLHRRFKASAFNQSGRRLNYVAYCFTSSKEGPNLCLSNYAGYCTLGGDVLVIRSQTVPGGGDVLTSTDLNEVHDILLALTEACF